ncbi:Leucine-rich repeat protein [Spironucleus salmonicida]|uniref:Leucine-rich repeat protein n=1 Tax=Spironucleus salmonicida TaxID=348837 RepID=V6LKT3_9EUKA|nr:Leucine-rich repeat protein [Spironucleus salmonicida]|eukprot:EST45240.1 hypothetical protein SS50377_14816 [Spironucleus salmonicida]
MLPTSEILKITGEINPESVTRLALPNKNISNTSNLNEFIRVFFLNLQNNNITDFEFIRFMPELKILHLGFNQINSLKPFNHQDEHGTYFFKGLEIVYLQNNQIRDLGEISFLSDARNLNIVDLRNNPILEQKGFQQTLLELTTVKTLNGMRVRTCTGLAIDYEKKEPEQLKQESQITIQINQWVSGEQFSIKDEAPEDYISTTMFNKVMDGVKRYWDEQTQK